MLILAAPIGSRNSDSSRCEVMMVVRASNVFLQSSKASRTSTMASMASFVCVLHVTEMILSCQRCQAHRLAWVSMAPSLRAGAPDEALHFPSVRIAYRGSSGSGVWSYSLKSKDQVFDVFKQFHALVERQTGKKLKCIRTDNGGEYIGPFDAYCIEKGIRHQKSPPKTPQLNGLVERMNRTLAERVKYRVWRGKYVSYNHLRVFGCKAFVHIPKDERSKLDVKTKPCIFLGYGQDEFGYRLYDPVSKKLVRSREVVFMEDQTLKDIEKVQTVPQYSDDLIDLDPPSTTF
ncbi:hypothetical protein E3N88_37967 [Mikania micrantha]|uniref:Integrase catalytic domain-containing protein n=1 Tax=Mikania micrantha TaxID=192012 RepID=A0A5N6LSY1_9ASTR|nr:hypothetical protein E3N88_37967 [Mikania micrantha]